MFIGLYIYMLAKYMIFENYLSFLSVKLLSCFYMYWHDIVIGNNFGLTRIKPRNKGRKKIEPRAGIRRVVSLHYHKFGFKDI